MLDFGLAKHAEGGDSLTARSAVSVEGHVIGTLAYMSPEQARGRPAEIDIRSDVYSLGVILYEALTGRRPYDLTGPMPAALVNIVRDEPKPPSTVNRRIDDEVETIVLKALSKDKDRRYQTAGALADDLEHYLAGDTIDAKRDSGWYVLKKTLRRYRAPVAVTASILVVITVALAVTIASLGRAERERERAEWQSYLANIGAADGALRLLYDVVQARLRLEAVPDRFHTNWEWRYLHNRLDQSIATLGEEGGPAVMSVAFSPDGDWFASGSFDGTIRVWDAATRHETSFSPLRGHTGPVNSVAINSNGTIIASGSQDQTVRLWDAQTGQALLPPLKVPEFEFAVRSVAFSPDGQKVAAGFATPDRDNGHAVVWNTATGEKELEWQAHDWVVSGVVFSPDGARIITGGEDGLVKIWDSAGGGELGESLRCGTARVEGVLTVAISSDGTQVAAGAKLGSLKLWDAGSRETIYDFAGHARNVQSVAFSPGGTILASASWDKTIRLWNTVTGKDVACLTGHTGQVNSVAFSPDPGAPGLLVSGSTDGTIKLWHATRTDAVPTLRGHVREFPSDVSAIAFSPDGTRLATAGRDHTVKLWDVATRAELASLPHETQVRGVAFCPNGVQLVSGTWGGRVCVWNTATREQVRQFDVRETDEAPLEAIALGPDGARVVSANGNTVKLWNIDTESASEYRAATVRERSLRGLAPGTLERSKEQKCALMMGHESVLHDVAISPDGSRIASASADHTVRVWDARTGASLHILKGHTQGVAGVTFSPDGELIASASGDHTIKLWNVSSGAEVRTLKGHSAALQCVAFSLDGTRLASGCEDHTIKLWDVGTGDELITLRDHTDAVTALAFSPDPGAPGLLVSASSDGTVKLWSAPIPQRKPDSPAE